MMHGCGKMVVAPASDAARCGDAWATPLPACRCCVWVYLFTILLFYIFLLWICADLASIHIFRRTEPIWPELGCIGRIGLYWPAAETNQKGWNSRNRQKSTLNHVGTAKIGFEWGPNILNLSFLNFILNICYFFCVFFFVLCFLPSSFFVLWTKYI